MRPLVAGCCLAAFVTSGLAAETPPVADESLYFDEMPVVLSVSRLAQPLDETPGAVTVIDRDMIRRSGAREVAELMRLVPGFIVSHFDGGARPFATYHGDYDAYNRHLQVYVDGRSVYSGLVLGNAAYGMMGLVLEDIERIEVLRGSNSAAYGANAFLGVVNIITRHAADTRGKLVSVTAGSQGVRDGVARIGWGDEDRAFRLTLASRRDDGFDTSADDKRVDQLHLRGDLRPSQHDDLSLAVGLTRFAWGAAEDLPIPARTETWRNAYLHGQWRRQLGATEELRVGALIDQEEYANFYPFLRADGRTRRFSVDAQHTLMPAENLRLVWGGEYRSEDLESVYLFAGDPEQHHHVWRLFGNVEWRLHPQWLINAGGLWERHSLVGNESAPRLMLHYHVVPGHTLRVGTTSAYKMPSQLELRGDWRMAIPGLGDIHLVQAGGTAEPERITAREIGYLGRFDALALTADLRIFEERVESVLRTIGDMPWDYANQAPSRQRGWEVQLRWQPHADTDILFNHADLHLDPDAGSAAPQDEFRTPKSVTTLALFQRLPKDFDLSLVYYRVGRMFWVRQRDAVPAYNQLDVRLAKAFRIDGLRAEAAVTAQAADGSHLDYTPAYRLDRRIFASLRLGF